MNKRKINNVIIDENRVIKKRNDKILELYDYLDKRGFDGHPKVLNLTDDNIESEFISKKEEYEMIKGENLIKAVSLLHNKTQEYKDVSKNKYRDIYDMLSGNIEYLKKYYENIISSIEEEIYMSPSHFLFARNYSALDSSLKYSSTILKRWFKKVEGKSKERVCIVHNNISSKHHIKGDKNYLISFDNYLVDTPVLDLYKFYKNEGFKLEFNNLLRIYEETNKLSEEEKMLLNVLISVPPKINMIKDEYLNCINVKNFYSYIYSSMNVVNVNK